MFVEEFLTYSRRRMREDNDQVLGNSVESCKDEPKPHQYPEENWEDAELKILENGKSDNNVCELFYDTRSSNEWDKENDGNILERHSFGGSNEARKKILETSHDFAAKEDSLEKVDPVFFMDKNCDLPEIVVCYHVVKDICVDEGVPVQEKFLFGNKDSVKCCSEDLVKGDKTYVNPFETMSSEDSIGKVNDVVICNDHKIDQDVEESLREVFADAEGSRNHNQEDLIVTEEPTHALNPFLDIESKEVAKSSEGIIMEYISLGDILSKEDEHKPLNNNGSCNEPEEQQSPPLLQEKEKGRLETTGLETEEAKSAEEKLSFVSTAISQESNKTCNEPGTDDQQQKVVGLDSYEEDDNKLFSNRFGETSFSAAETVSISGHITYSGPITFAGNLSVRSDASTTSGRSFAFPILQSEWNSSPVRMAKADKRRHKGWRCTLLCCRFS